VLLAMTMMTYPPVPVTFTTENHLYLRVVLNIETETDKFENLLEELVLIPFS